MQKMPINKMLAHTPGPWKIGFRSNKTPIYGANNEHIAWMDGSAYAMGTNRLTSVGETNARLIAKAPEMHATIKQLIDELVNLKNGEWGTFDCPNPGDLLEEVIAARALLAEIDPNV